MFQRCCHRSSALSGIGKNELHCIFVTWSCFCLCSDEKPSCPLRETFVSADLSSYQLRRFLPTTVSISPQTESVWSDGHQEAAAVRSVAGSGAASREVQPGATQGVAEENEDAEEENSHCYPGAPARPGILTRLTRSVWVRLCACGRSRPLALTRRTHQ